MAKDPAINWYFDNWAGGTKLMTRFIKGCYIDLLDAQFHNGHLSLEEIKIVLGADFSVWGSLSKKFAVDETGKYFNERLDHEILKRENFSNKQKERVNKRWNKSGIDSGNTMVLPIIETETEIEIKTGSFEKSEKLLIPEMLKEWKKTFKNYPEKKETDYPALLSIAQFIADKEKIDCDIGVIPVFRQFITCVAANDFYKDKSLQTIGRKIQDIVIKSINGTTKTNGKSDSHNLRQQVNERFAQRYPQQ